MQESEVTYEIGRLFAAFPGSKASDATATVYCNALVSLRYPQALHDAVDALIATEQWLPPVARIHVEYRVHRGKYLPKELPLPDVSDEQVAVNMKRLDALGRHTGARGREGHSLDIASCEHPDCQELRSVGLA